MNDNIQETINQFEAEIAEQENLLTDLEAEVLDLEQQLESFKVRYNKLIAPLVTKLDTAREVQKDLERDLYMVQRFGKSDIGSTPSRLPDDYVPVMEQYRRVWKPSESDSPRAFIKATPTIPKTPETDLKRLYRKLARRYHPDLTTDPTEREHRTKLMAQLNDAYQANDLSALESLARTPEHLPPAQPLAIFRLRELQQIRKQLAHRIETLSDERATILRSEMMQMSIEEKLAKVRKQDYLKDVAKRLEKDYAACILKIDELRRELAQY